MQTKKGQYVKVAPYASYFVDVYPFAKDELPSSEHFHAFFSRFGPIFELYRFKSTKPHVYIVFKTETAVQNLKVYIRSSESNSYWKTTFKISPGASSCPAELLNRIKAGLPPPAHNDQNTNDSGNQPTTETQGIPISVGVSRIESNAESSRMLGKHSRDVPPHLEQGRRYARFDENDPPSQSKRFKPNDETRSENVRQQATLQTGEEMLGAQNRPNPVPVQAFAGKADALELARQAVEIASSRSKTVMKRGDSNDVEQLVIERDLAISERDSAIAERDAALESHRALEQQFQNLKKSIQERDEKTDKVLRLVTASLQSLQEGDES